MHAVSEEGNMAWSWCLCSVPPEDDGELVKSANAPKTAASYGIQGKPKHAEDGLVPCDSGHLTFENARDENVKLRAKVAQLEYLVDSLR